MLSTRETLHPASPVTIKYRSIIRPASVQGVRSCVSCSLKAVCLPCGLDAAEIADFSVLVKTKRKIARGTQLL